MAVTVQNIIPAKYAENAQTAQYTSVDGKTIIDKFTGTNVSGADVTLSINLVGNSESAANNNLIVQTQTLTPGEAYTFPEIVNQSLEVGDFISTLASAASAVVISSSGRIITDA